MERGMPPASPTQRPALLPRHSPGSSHDIHPNRGWARPITRPHTRWCPPPGRHHMSPIVLVYISLIALVVLGLFGVWLLYRARHGREPAGIPPAAPRTKGRPPRPPG